MKLSAAILPLLVSAAPALAITPPPGGGYPSNNTVLGTDALFSITSAYPNDNTAIGFQALYHDTSIGSSNTAVGSNALFGNTTGNVNVAVGWQAMAGNTTGSENTAVGKDALSSNTTGGFNVAVGYQALTDQTIGYENVAVGNGAMFSTSAGDNNVAVGNAAMAFSTGNGENVAIGHGAMNLSAGFENVAIGQNAGLNLAGDFNVAIGPFAAMNLGAGANNVMIGQDAGLNVKTGSNNVEIANQGAKQDTGFIRIGDSTAQKKTFIAGISGVTVADGVGVVVNSKGQLGVATSSARHKEGIEPMKEASEAILSLEPVKFRYKKDLDPQAIPQFGLVAEQVAKVDPDLVARDESGKPYTVRYEAVNAMLLNEFLKEHRKVEAEDAMNQRQEEQLMQQGAVIAGQEKEIASLSVALKEQAAQIQKVSAQVAGDHAPRVVANGE